MQEIKISTAQFENKSGDKEYNLSVIDKLSAQASAEGAKVVVFHECSITGYTFAKDLTEEQMLDVAEFIPEGKSIETIKTIASKHDIVVLAGLFEKDSADNLYNAFVCVDKNGLIAKHRKLHPFINPNLKAGSEYSVFELFGWKCGILTCYDNNVVENVRATALLGAQIIFMPHVTGCTPSPRPGAGFVNPQLWENRIADPTSLRLEFDGMKSREWLMKWLPARAQDNAVYAVFSNPIGMDYDQLKSGGSMILDPFGDILAECRMLDNGIATATLTPEKLTQSGGYRYIQARRPELFRDILGKSHESELKVAWLAK